MNISILRNSIIGRNQFMNGPYGKRLITYADYTASGRTVQFIEEYLKFIQQTYANTHTQDNCTGKKTSFYYREAKSKILEYLGANDNYVVLPSGNGVTGAICKLQSILGVYEAPKTKKNKQELMQKALKERQLTGNKKSVQQMNDFLHKNKPVVFITCYEHHSNELMWREAFCEVVKVNMSEDGSFELNHLSDLLNLPKYQNRLLIGSFSAASNVTGIKTPVYKIAELMHKHNGLVFFDFAASAPYVDINLASGELSYFDGIYLSPHKFIGGPGSSGLLVINKSIYDLNVAPTCAGGGTVNYVGNSTHFFNKNIEIREDAGTPAILQVIKAALALELKNKIGVSKIEKVEHSFLKRASKRLYNNPNIEIIGPKSLDKLSIFSFNIRYKNGYFHHKYIAKLLNDIFGIQTRAGCACAGPYGHFLLDIGDEVSEQYRQIIASGEEIMKPGWVRLNFHFTISNEEFKYLLNAIDFVANNAHKFISDYVVHDKTGTWCHKSNLVKKESNELCCTSAIKHKNKSLFTPNRNKLYKRYTKKAQELADQRSVDKPLMLYKQQEYQNVTWFFVHPNNFVANKYSGGK